MATPGPCGVIADISIGCLTISQQKRLKSCYSSMVERLLPGAAIKV